MYVLFRLKFIFHPQISGWSPHLLDDKKDMSLQEKKNFLQEQKSLYLSELICMAEIPKFWTDSQISFTDKKLAIIISSNVTRIY